MAAAEEGAGAEEAAAGEAASRQRGDAESAAQEEAPRATVEGRRAWATVGTCWQLRPAGRSECSESESGQSCKWTEQRVM